MSRTFETAVLYLRNLDAPQQILSAIPKLIGQDFGDDTFEYIDFDVSVYQKQMTMPVFMLYGTGDMSMPTVQGPLVTREDLDEAGNSDLTVRYYKDADHGLQVDKVLVMQAMQDTADWVNGLPDTADALPHVARAQPEQDYMAGRIESAAVVRFWHGGRMDPSRGRGIGDCWRVADGVRRSELSPEKLLNFHGCGAVVNLGSVAVIVAWILTLVYTISVADLAVSINRTGSLFREDGSLSRQ